MSATEQEQGQQVEARSSIKLTLNAKGEVQIEVKTRVGDEELEIDTTRRIAEINFDALKAKYRP